MGQMTSRTSRVDKRAGPAAGKGEARARAALNDGNAGQVVLHAVGFTVRFPLPMKFSPRAAFSPVTRRVFLGHLSVGAAALASAPLIRAQPAAPKKLGVALVGLGNYSRGQLGPALKLTEHCRLAGVVTGDPAKGAQWAKDYGFSEKAVYGYDTMARLADNKDIDIVYVVTPNGLHARDVIAAARAGKHVICEKPMGNTVAECDAMLAACRAAKVKFSIGYRLHFDPYHREMMRLAKDPTVAPFLKMTGNRGFALRPGLWRADKKLAGGGPMMDLGVYLIQAACMAYGGTTLGGGALDAAPSFVTGKERPKTKPQQFGEGVEETIDYSLEFKNGAKADFVASYVGGKDTFRAESAKGFIEFKEKAFTYRGAIVETHRGPLNFGPYVNQQALQMDDFAQCVKDNRDTRVPGEMGRRDLVIIEAIYEAARTGRKVAVRV
jgi:glucose-fructose oxidoreductase